MQVNYQCSRVRSMCCVFSQDLSKGDIFLCLPCPMSMEDNGWYWSDVWFPFLGGNKSYVSSPVKTCNIIVEEEAPWHVVSIPFCLQNVESFILWLGFFLKGQSHWKLIMHDFYWWLESLPA